MSRVNINTYFIVPNLRRVPGASVIDVDDSEIEEVPAPKRRKTRVSFTVDGDDDEETLDGSETLGQSGLPNSDGSSDADKSISPTADGVDSHTGSEEGGDDGANADVDRRIVEPLRALELDVFMPLDGEYLGKALLTHLCSSFAQCQK